MKIIFNLEIELPSPVSLLFEILNNYGFLSSGGSKEQDVRHCSRYAVAVYGKVRVVRSCGYIADEKDNGECLMRSGTHDVRVSYCSCTSDLCNSVENLRTPSLLPLASLLTAVLATPSLLLSSSTAPPHISLSTA